ncbi:probable cytochrome P450 6a14 [Temnothorax curvispinosus]|uniref:Probable cytochrome P450 6a14 n=1 Tax=Temnothorax curvispinosus TaxID=300111 RepID=A0A6J1PM28_9HYME|nr:probable cytochrome P450 6a14 [Temnothorax curvispinosus]XP_024870708.1 probable cytochrome P450 6a14 [Temnothorax curvispinosus]XP_024870709.1 probable cytochrome P450 6a14 [Temnothorax curvispinosus]XP_024870710.1 probable cytochrome P450 6a14 [Temnothorax curvispinosus]XP_024870711.1 probable cytochrome P450 6a14 [Temnothorax curvispinosus]
MLTEWIGALIVVLSVVYIYYKYVVFSFWRKRNVFYVEPVVPAGNLTALVTGKVSVGELFRDAYLKYKSYRAFGMYMFFKPNLIIADPDLIQMVLTREFKCFHDRGLFCNEKTDPLTGHLFCLSGKKWRNLRLKLTSSFTPGKTKQLFMILKECGEEFAKSLESEARTRDCIEMKEMFARFSTDIIMSTAFGIKSNCMKQPNNEFRYWGRKIFEERSLLMAFSMFAPQIMDFFSLPALDRGVTKFFTTLFRDNVEYRRTHNIVRHDFVNLLMQLMEKGYVEPEDEKDISNISPNVSKLTMSEAAAQAFVFYLAGFETSATTATYCLYELACHQHLQDKVCKEIDEILKKHGEVSYNALNEMTYLHKVINETMRKYPPVPILNRICTEAVTLPTTNIHVPKGTSITIPVLGLHRDPSIYPDPDKFDPERFNVDAMANRHPYAYLPFGEGPRICIGMKFGYIQTKVGLVSLLSRFKFKLHSQTPVPLTFDEASILVLAVKGGVPLIVEQR